MPASLMLERYLAGEYEQVYTELCGRGSVDPEACAVAEEIIRRVRTNLEKLVARWRTRGFHLLSALGRPGESSEVVRRVEEVHGRLPPTLRAFYEQIGWVNFVEPPPGPPWPEEQQIDSIQVLDIRSQATNLLERQVTWLFMFDDGLHKFGYSGCGPFCVDLPASGFDATLNFEGEPIFRFVEYLRDTILRRGGMGPCCQDPPDPELVASLVVDLEPF